MSACNWPFHNQPGCTTCTGYEQLYGEGIDEWLIQKQEIRAAAKAARHQENTQAGGTASGQPT